jgi:hypothetical protein
LDVYGMRLLLLLAASCLLAACAPKGNAAFMNPCSSMDAEVREKQALDARVKTTEKQLREYRKQGDTASAASASRRLVLMQENQRLLKESVEQSSRDCSPTFQDPAPVRDPASRDIAPK